MWKALFLVLTASLLTLILPVSSVTADVVIVIPNYIEKVDKQTGAVTYVLAKDGKAKEKTLAALTRELKGSGYRVRGIQIWIKGTVESGSVTKYLMAIDGEAGMKIGLDPSIR
ncbi:MAG: hypothetical protein QNI92_12570 [Desulfobacterales bacterium]|nr:hypothetical protein [Desulfobacterales bacterium]MDJ0912570.1 hypothetical protein [Desulfobacterales bacterium]